MLCSRDDARHARWPRDRRVRRHVPYHWCLVLLLAVSGFVLLADGAGKRTLTTAPSAMRSALPPLEEHFLAWHTGGRSRDTAGAEFHLLLLRWEQALGSMTLPAASIQVLYDVATDCLSPLSPLQQESGTMQNFSLLRAAGRNSKQRPVLLKRGHAAIIDTWLLAAERIGAVGNVLREQGIRSFDPQTRNVLDLACVPLLHALTQLPVIVDPSHATGTGRRELVPVMAWTALAAGADGLMVERHTDPECVLCDGRPSIIPEQLHEMVSDSALFARSREKAVC